jgi:hypothetical protein
MALVELYHYVKTALASIFIGILEHALDKILQLFINLVILGRLVDILQVSDDAAVQKLSQLFVLAFKQLQEDGENGCGWDDVFTAHDLEASDEAHAHFGV